MLNMLGVCLVAMMMCLDISVHTSLQAFGTRFFVALLPAVHTSPVVVYYYFLAELEQILVDILGLSGNVVAQDTFSLSGNCDFFAHWSFWLTWEIVTTPTRTQHNLNTVVGFDTKMTVQTPPHHHPTPRSLRLTFIDHN